MRIFGMCIWRVLAIAAGIAVSATPASAHAFGARYDLPLPLWLYLTGAGAAVALTFAILVLFMRDRPRRWSNEGLEITGTLVGRILLRPWLRMALNVLGVALFALVLITGLFGVDNALKNFAPTFVWVIWWVGLAFIVALIGNIWPVLNPWDTLFRWRLGLARRAGTIRQDDGRVPYPAWLGVWPSILFFMVFAWTELISDSGEKPRTLALLIVAYTMLQLAGMGIYGRRSWLARGEVFSRFFDVLGRMAPLHGRYEGDGARLWLRPYGGGLAVRDPVSVSMTVFVIVMLSTVTFDGFVETPAWAGFLDWLGENRTLRSPLVWLQTNGIDLLMLVKTLALVLFPCVFLGVFIGVCALSSRLGGGRVGVGETAGTQVLSLVPIAVAYHVAHYLSYLLLAGQLIIPLFSDPFGWGWDLFGTADRTIDITVINTKTVWYTAIVAIVTGHVLAVYLAHVMALASYSERRAALRSQVPMLMLMVLYTMCSLWILSQPIVEV